MKKITSHLYKEQSNWRGLLWFLTSVWRWPAFQQRQFLAWWQVLGWKDGLAQLEQCPTSQTIAWGELREWLTSRSDESTRDRWHWITLVDPEFPESLRFFESAPTVLWSNHPWEVWQGPIVTVVGSRRSSTYGRMAVQNLVPSFTQQWNALIISGGAMGIDQAAHDAALQVGQPTWIVLGCGLDHTPAVLGKYGSAPARLVSPFPPQDPAEKWRFPARNRVMAQLAQAVLVVEAAEKSGSLITAGAALEYGKDVMVVLPPFSSPNASGAVRLLQKGAFPVAQALDIAQCLGLAEDMETPLKQLVGKTHDETAVLRQLLDMGGAARIGSVVSEVSKNRGLENRVVQSIITTLELRGWIQSELGMIRLSGMIQS